MSYIRDLTVPYSILSAMELQLFFTDPSTPFNSLFPGRCGYNFKGVIFKLIIILWIGILGASCKIVVRWMPQNSIDDKSTLVKVMAWCCQASSHYLNLCWPRSPYSVTRPQGLTVTVQIALPTTCRFWHNNIEPCLTPENLHQIFSFWSHLKANCM